VKLSPEQTAKYAREYLRAWFWNEDRDKLAADNIATPHAVPDVLDVFKNLGLITYTVSEYAFRPGTPIYRVDLTPKGRKFIEGGQ